MRIHHEAFCSRHATYIIGCFLFYEIPRSLCASHRSLALISPTVLFLLSVCTVLRRPSAHILASSKHLVLPDVEVLTALCYLRKWIRGKCIFQMGTCYT